MLNRIIPIVTAFLALHPSAGWTQPPTPAQPSEPSSPAEQVFVFERRCATCHDNPGSDSRALSREALRALTPERVLAALTTGSMASNATGISELEKRAMAELVTGKPFGGSAERAASAMKKRCESPLP
jgi:polyvinyl alcohol dehydrogenase (cytochrome)